MSELAKRYNLTEEQYKKMVDDGVISTSYPRYDEIYECFKESLKNCSQSEAVYIVQEKMRVSRTTVYSVIAKFR